MSSAGRLPRSVSRPARAVFGRALIVALYLVSARPGWAAGDGTPAPEAAPAGASVNEEGMELYRAHDYRRAVEKFLQAYAIDRDPNVLFNIARCYEALGDREAAREKYQAFLQNPAADRDGRARAQAALARLQGAKVAPSGPEIGGFPPAPADGAATSPTASSSWSSSSAPAEKQANERRGGARLWRWVALGGGVALVGVSGALFALGARDHDKVTGAPGFGNLLVVDPMTEAEAQKLVDSGARKKLAGAIVLGVGGAALATSALLFVLTSGPDARPRRDGIALAVSAGPGAAGLSLGGRF